MDGVWTGSNFPLGFGSQAKHSGYWLAQINYFWYTRTNNPLALINILTNSISLITL
jgi:hypothetical protein